MNAIFTLISLGLLSTTSPCVLPLYPGFLAYLSGGHRKIRNSKARYLLGFFALAGVLTMMLLLGSGIALLSISIGRALAVVIPLADIIIFTLGLLLQFNFNLFKSIPQIRIPLISHPYSNAYLYGFLYGPIALPCSGPLVVSIFAYSLTAGEVLGKLAIFFWFGIGFGLPLLLLSILSGANQRWLTRLFTQHTRLINLIGGILLIGVGIFDLISNWKMIQTFLGI